MFDKVSTFINKHKKLVGISSGILYLGLTALIIFSSLSLFNNLYYSRFYVSGTSMNPTLSGASDGHDYGIVDKSYGAKKQLKRYQIVTTHYFEGDDTKIKRVIALPGETFKIVDDELYLYNSTTSTWSDKIERNFEIYSNYRNYPETTLKDDEYFLAGDNRLVSADSFFYGPIKFDLLIGVVVKIDQKCIVDDQERVVKSWSTDVRYFLGVDY